MEIDQFKITLLTSLFKNNIIYILIYINLYNYIINNKIRLNFIFNKIIEFKFLFLIYLYI